MQPSQTNRTGAPTPRHLGMRDPGGPPERPPARARILWPALGFPAVIAPAAQAGTSPFTDGDATRCICVLVLADRPLLSKADAARSLRCVPWAERARRSIAMGGRESFREEELDVRRLDRAPPPWKHRTDRHGEVVTFGADGDGRNGVVAKLAARVREVCRQERLEHLHEIRVHEHALARFGDGLHQLLWNNAAATEQAPSDEMALLLRAVARPRRARLGALWDRYRRFLMDEYEYEYGALHAPYNAGTAGRGARAEVLHPLFVRRERRAALRIGQVTDVHVATRNDEYEANLRRNQEALRRQGVAVPVPFNNWNTSFARNYAQAKGDSDVILLTGDLVDYGRGWYGLGDRPTLGRDDLYHEDRNWFLFYYLLAGGDAYEQPVYTILGNHDWRLNPYTPFAIAGSPSAEAMIHGADRYSAAQRKLILQTAHGPGHERLISYVSDIERTWQLFRVRHLRDSVAKLVRAVIGGGQTADLKQYPTETRVESVEWYLHTINPFLDYAFTHPQGTKLLMLDWAEDENVLFEEITHGRKHGINVVWLFGGDPGGEGPKARDCLTELQYEMVVKFTEESGGPKVIGIHVPPIGPWADWYDDELLRGLKTYAPDETPRGSLGFATRTSGFPRPMQAHPLFAIRPPMQVSSDPIWGMDASSNSFERHREDFIRRVADPRFGVRLVLSGHIHRNGMFATYVAGKERGPALAGRTLIQYVPPAAAQGARPPAVSRAPAERAGSGARFAAGPLYVNTTSGGPRGHLYASRAQQVYVDPGWAHLELARDGTIQQVEFRPTGPIATVATPARRVVARR